VDWLVIPLIKQILLKMAHSYENMRDFIWPEQYYVDGAGTEVDWTQDVVSDTACYGNSR
jgi:hypothetical protein